MAAIAWTALAVAAHAWREHRLARDADEESADIDEFTNKKQALDHNIFDLNAQ